MSRAWKALAVLLGVQAVLAAAAAALDWTYSCGACRAGGFSLGLVGFAFYAGLFLAAMLVAQLLSAGLRCWLCFGAAGLSMALVALAVAHDRSNLARMALVLPWPVLLVLGWNGAPKPTSAASAVVTDTAAVRMVVFTQSDCPYCDQLREQVMPEVEREFGPRVQVVYRPASDLPAVRRTPTIVVSPGRRDQQARVIEGLPTVDMLRSAVREMEAKP